MAAHWIGNIKLAKINRKFNIKGVSGINKMIPITIAITACAAVIALLLWLNDSKVG